MIAPLAPSSIHSMASITILFRRSVPVLHRSPCSCSRCVSLGLPSPSLRPVLSTFVPHTRAPGSRHLWLSPFLRVPSQHGLLVRFVFSPRRVRFRFPQFPPALPSPSLRPVIPTLVLLPPPRPQAIRLFPVHLSDSGSTSPTLRISCCGPRVCRSAPTPLPRSGKVNRASGGN